MTMQPGQLTPNELELAILERIARDEPELGERIPQIHVLSREFTGVGSFTNFRRNDSAAAGPDRHVGLDGLIKVPAVPNGLGAVLFCTGVQPRFLEIYTLGDDRWDGTYDDFSIEQTV